MHVANAEAVFSAMMPTNIDSSSKRPAQIAFSYVHANFLIIIVPKGLDIRGFSV